MAQHLTRLVHGICRSCRVSYSTEASDVIRGGEAWPSRCPMCGRIEVRQINPRDLTIIREAPALLAQP